MINVEDREIIALFFKRNEQAITEVKNKYHGLISHIAGNILGNTEDMEECENDVCLALWERIPPETPAPLSAYIGRIARNNAVNRYHKNTAVKRDNRYDLVLDEMTDWIPDDSVAIESDYEAKVLTQAIEAFLMEQNQEDRFIFMRRFWFVDSITEIAEQLDCSPHRVTMRFSRIRKRLQKYLKKEGLIE